MVDIGRIGQGHRGPDEARIFNSQRDSRRPDRDGARPRAARLIPTLPIDPELTRRQVTEVVVCHHRA